MSCRDIVEIPFLILLLFYNSFALKIRIEYEKIILNRSTKEDLKRIIQNNLITVQNNFLLLI